MVTITSIALVSISHLLLYLQSCPGQIPSLNLPPINYDPLGRLSMYNSGHQLLYPPGSL